MENQKIEEETKTIEDNSSGKKFLNKKIIFGVLFLIIVSIGIYIFINFDYIKQNIFDRLQEKYIHDDGPYFYGQIRMDKERGIKNYLLSQEYFSSKTSENSHSFCSIKNLGNTLGFPTYEWVYCSEFTLSNNEITQIGGVSVPVKIDYPKYGESDFDLSLFSYDVPRDGSYYLEDLKKIFPDEIQQNIIKTQNNINSLEISVKEQAEKWFALQKEIAKESKYIDSENNETASILMSDNGKEITLNYKDFKNLTLKETTPLFPQTVMYKNSDQDVAVIYYNHTSWGANGIQIIINDDWNNDFSGKLLEN